MAFEQFNGGYTFTAPTVADLLPGYLVKAMSTAEAGTSNPEDVIKVDKCDAAGDAKLCVGISLGSTTSGNLASVATGGMYRVYAAAAVDEGVPVTTSADPLAVQPITFTCAGSEQALVYTGDVIGKTLNPAGSGEEVFILLNTSNG